MLLRRQDLPADLLAQFPVDALDVSQHPARQPFMDRLCEIYKTWQTDRSDGSVVLVGRTGMGKSTTLRLLQQELEGSMVVGDLRTKITRPAEVIGWLADTFDLRPRPGTEQELIQQLRDAPQDAVAIDNCHNLFLRQVNGFSGWEAFVRVVNETCDRIFWVLTIGQAAWEYLNNVAGRVHYFRRLIPLPAWSEDQIRTLIMQRMRRARFGVSFSELLVTQVEGLSVAAQLGRTSSGYFRLLWDLSGGNPRLAGHFWLDSLVPQPDRRLVRVHLFNTPHLEELEQLTDEILFILTAVTEHQDLSVHEAAGVTNLSLDFCKFAVKLCLEEGYLEQTRGGDRYRLSRRWQVAIVHLLKRRHLLYGER